MKSKYLTVVLCILMLFTSCSDKSISVAPEELTDIETVEKYPTDDNGAVEVDYAKKLLKKKSSGTELSKFESKLINFFFMHNECGMAVVDVHGIGMQKVALQVYRTLDSGKTWELLKNGFFVSSGYLDCVFLNDKLLFSNYASVTEKTNFFFVGIDGSDLFVSDEQLNKLNFDNSKLQVKLTYVPEENHVICSWIENYNLNYIKYTTVHDECMNLIIQTEGNIK